MPTSPACLTALASVLALSACSTTSGPPLAPGCEPIPASLRVRPQPLPPLRLTTPPATLPSATPPTTSRDALNTAAADAPAAAADIASDESKSVAGSWRQESVTGACDECDDGRIDGARGEGDVGRVVGVREYG